MGAILEGLTYAGPQILAGYGAGMASGEQARQQRAQQEALLRFREMQLQAEAAARQATARYQQDTLRLREREVGAREKEPEERRKQADIEFLRKQIAENWFQLQESGQLVPFLEQLGGLTGQVPIGRYLPERQATPDQEAMMRLREGGPQALMGEPRPGATRTIPGRVVDVPRLAMPEAERQKLLQSQALTRYYGAQADVATDREARLAEQFTMDRQFKLMQFRAARSDSERDHLVALGRLSLERLRAAQQQLTDASLGRLREAQIQKTLQEIQIAKESLPPGVVATLNALEPAFKLEQTASGRTQLLSDPDSVAMRQQYLRLLGLAGQSAQDTLREYAGGGGTRGPDQGFERVYPPGSIGAPGAQGVQPAPPAGQGRGVVPRGAGALGLPPNWLVPEMVLPGGAAGAALGTRIGLTTPPSAPTGRRGVMGDPERAAPKATPLVPSPAPRPSPGTPPPKALAPTLATDVKKIEQYEASGLLDRVMRFNEKNPKRLAQLKAAYRKRYGKEYGAKGSPFPAPRSGPLAAQKTPAPSAAGPKEGRGQAGVPEKAWSAEWTEMMKRWDAEWKRANGKPERVLFAVMDAAERASPEKATYFRLRYRREFGKAWRGVK